MENTIKYIVIGILAYFASITISIPISLVLVLLFVIIDYKQVLLIGLVDKMNESVKQFKQDYKSLEDNNKEMRMACETESNLLKDLIEQNTTMTFYMSYTLEEEHEGLIKDGIYYIRKDEKEPEMYNILKPSIKITKEELNKFKKINNQTE